MLYEIEARDQCCKNYGLTPKSIYFLRGPFFPSNTQYTKSDLLLFKGKDQCFISNADTFAGTMTDVVGVTGVGVVFSIESLEEELAPPDRARAPGEITATIVVTVLHCDYNPITKSPAKARVEYRIRPFGQLRNVHRILTIGREYQFHGFIKDFNDATACYIVMVNKVSPTNVHTEYNVTGPNATGQEVTAETANNQTQRLSTQFRLPCFKQC
ncbi:uncharacterized protein MELLADRAFT_88672 [Melampsora larici-populina 98AG31]|uniref:Uncharacterized protein n=1 Tax=Melampsora larici-populina (strain 98AG31 / pathotype 3-4-7) TaxID=747676 RepID=F4RSK3_MELLP|nr:uncharacterized protein MELLADRAFT_88672 [Melampsora larici-populina 98AG31]EGG04679.1 hypothetical protein MELLADRAFT_88672 [Melampsora larici-populina 98AG31]